MPISVVCSSCSAKLNAPDTAAGKKIKCPKCQAVCSVPAPASDFEVVDEPEPGPKPKPKKTVAKATVDDDEERPRKRKAADEDDEDDRPRAKKKATRQTEDDEDDRPRKRKRDRDEEQAGGSSKLLIGGIIGVLLLAGVGFAVYWFGFRGKTDSTNPTNPDSVKAENWETYTSPGNVFKVSFPGKPEAQDWQPKDTLKVTSDLRQLLIGDKRADKPSHSYFAGYIRFPDGTKPQATEATRKWLITLYASPATAGRDSQFVKKVMVGDREWEELRIEAGESGSGILRCHYAGSILYLVGYQSNLQSAAKDSAEKFLASYEILGGDPGDPDPVKLDGWEPYTSTDNVFQASFPGATKKMENYSFTNVKAGEFREYTVTDEKTKATRTYFAGYVRFPKKPTYQEAQAVKNFVQSEALGGSSNTGQRRVAVGGWPWGEERQMEVAKSGFGGSTNGIVRWVEAGSTIYAVGMKNTTRFPADKEIDKFFSSFEILDAKPEKKDFDMPPGWALYKQPKGEFQAIMPGQVHTQPAMLPKGNALAIASANQYIGSDLNVDLMVFVVQFPPNSSEADRTQALDWLARQQLLYNTQKPKLETRNKITWAGRDAEELVSSPPDVCIARETRNATVGYVAVIHAKNGKFDPNLARVFLDSFAFDK